MRKLACFICTRSYDCCLILLYCLSPNNLKTDPFPKPFHLISFDFFGRKLIPIIVLGKETQENANFVNPFLPVALIPKMQNRSFNSYCCFHSSCSIFVLKPSIKFRWNLLKTQYTVNGWSLVCINNFKGECQETMVHLNDYLYFFSISICQTYMWRKT